VERKTNLVLLLKNDIMFVRMLIKKTSLFLVIILLFSIFTSQAEAGYVYNSKFGDFNTTNTPAGIVIDSSGNIYIASVVFDGINKFDSSRVFQFGFANEGTGNGQTNSPHRVNIDSAGNIFVADAGNSRIQKFNSAGVFQSKFGNSGTGNGQFGAGFTTSPFGVTIDSSDNIYVPDAGNDRIQKFDSSGVFQSKFGSYGSGNGQFYYPYDIAIDSYNNIYVADTYNNRVQKFNSSGVYQLQFGGFGSGDGEFNQPKGIAIDSFDNIYVADTNNHRVQRFNSAGVYQSQFGSSGSGNGQFNHPHDIAFDSLGLIYIADYDNNRIQVFTSIAVSVSESSISVLEGEEDTYSIVLDSEPTSNVVITLSTSDPLLGSGITLSASELTFTPENWNTPQEITVTAVDDFVLDENRSVTISSVVVSDDSNYDGESVSEIEVIITEDESEPGVTLSEASFNLNEGEGGVYTIVLDSELTTENVVINLSASDPVSGSGVTLSSSELIFTSENWDTLQEVTVTAEDDETVDGNRSTIISSTIDTDDVNYDGLIIDDINVNISEDDAVSITTCAELQAMNEDLSEFYALANDIDCTGFDPEENGKGFIPVGTSGDPFTGGFFGNGYTISNLTINRPDEYYVGLFGYIYTDSATTFSNLTITGSIVGYGLTGAFAGRIDSEVTLENINSIVSVTNTDGDGYVGGLVGYASSVINILDSNVSANITTDYSYEGTGGLVGYASSGGSIENSSYEGTITVNPGNYVEYGVGGLLGYNSGDVMNITSSHATGAINITADYVYYGVGGLAGYYYGGDITDSYADMDITINTTDYVEYGVGGLYGYSSNNANITNSHYTGDILITTETGYVYSGVGGLFGYNDSPTNITLSSATGSINVDSGDYVEYGIGGLVGYYYYGGDIDQSYSGMNITINAVDYVDYGVGGLYGINESNVNVSDSYSRGDISVTTESDYIEYIGGLLGAHHYSDLTVNNSYSTGDITLNSGSGIFYVGGLMGDVSSGDSYTTTNSFSTSKILLTSGSDNISNVGAVVGFENDGTFENTFFDRLASREDFCTGDGGEVDGCTGIIDPEGDDFKGNNTNAPLDTWDFDEVWRVNVGAYPTFADNTAPTLEEVNPVETPSAETRPIYTFSTDEAGTISYDGSCSSNDTSAVLGENTITFNKLSPGTYSDCTIIVTDDSNNASDPLSVSAFTIKGGSSGGGSSSKKTTTPPVVTLPTPVGTPSPVGAPILPTPIGTPSPVGAPSSPLPPTYKTLKLGMTDPEVKLLQIYLNTHGFPVSLTGPGSLGLETNFFGPKTKAAVILFQKAKGLVPDGIVGPKTKAVMI